MDEAYRGAARLHPARRDAEGIHPLNTARQTRDAGAGAGWLPALLSFRGVIAFWAVFGVAHAALRFFISHTLIIDDARANELTQNFALGYQIRQPPLYEWVLWCVQQVLGPGIESHLVVRYSLILLIGVTTFGAVRAAVKSDRWAAAASLSLALSFPVSWTFHEWGTQTLLLCAGCMMTLHAAIRFFEGPGVRTAMLLGAALSFGLYAKFSFPLMAGGLLLAALSLPEMRRKLADARLLLSLAVLAILFSPYARWVANVQGSLVSDLAGHLVGANEPHMARAAYGLWRLATSSVTFLLPWLAIVALLVPQAFMKPPADAAPPSFAEKLALRTMLFALAIVAVGIVALGATNIAARYMHPVLFIAPVYIFARAARLAKPVLQPASIAAAAVVASLAVLGIRFAAATDNPFTRIADRRLLLPYAALADEVHARGLDRGTVVSFSVREAGNLRAFLPGVRVISQDSLRVERPPRMAAGEGCTLLWSKEHEDSAKQIAGERFAQAEQIDIPARLTGPIAWRPGTWFVLRLDSKSPVCR